MPLSTLTVALGLASTLLAPLTLRPAQFVSLLLVGAFVGSFAAMLRRSVAEDRALDSREGFAEAGRNAVVGAVWAVAGGALLFSLGSYGWTAAGAALLAYPLLRVLLRLVRAVRPSAGRVRPSDEGLPGRLCPPPFDECSTSELAAAWGASYDLLQAASSPQVKARIVALRGAYLDELQRRDQLGVEQWLTFGADPASDTEEYFRNPEEGGEAKPGVG